MNVYTYDAVGNLTSMSDATGKVSYGYNTVNLVTSLVEPDRATTSLAYDPTATARRPATRMVWRNRPPTTAPAD